MRLSIDLPDELHRKVKAQAANEGRTISTVVRKYLEQYATYVPSTAIKVPAPAAPRPKPPSGPISKSDQAKGRSRK